MAIDEHDSIRIGSTRITLDTIIARYHQGDSPESIQQGFTSLSLRAIFAVIAYYLAHQEELDRYLALRDQTAQQLRQQIEATYTPEQRQRHDQLGQLLAATSS